MSGLACGIVGLPNVGKSTLFNALIKKIAAAAANYPFCTIEPNTGVVDVPDPRLQVLSDLSHSTKIIPASVKLVDIAGLVRGASKGEGMGNKFLSNIRETDAIVHVVRCFEDDNVIHVEGKVNPIDDIEVINLELILADIQMIENVIPKLEKQAKAQKELLLTIELLKEAQKHLDSGKPMRTFALNAEQKELLKIYQFLTIKPVLYVANVSESDLPQMENAHVAAVRAYAAKEGSRVIPICAKLEEELSSLSPEEAAEYLSSLGLQETGLNRLIKAAFETLGLITFITTGEIETRAWTITQGTRAQDAAGKIHSDIAKGFIRAETITYSDYIACGSRPQAKEAGKARSEGKDYLVHDGDVILFYHS